MSAQVAGLEEKSMPRRLQVIEGGADYVDFDEFWESEYQSARDRHPAFRQRKLQETTRKKTGVAGILKLGAYVILVPLLFVFGVAIGSWFGSEDYRGHTQRHSVQPGESVWSIAQNIETTRPLGQVVDDIRVLNGIGTGMLAAGEVLTIPAQ